jgi:hypothetical protein
MAIAAIPMKAVKTVKNSQIAIRINESGFFISSTPHMNNAILGLYE